MTEKNTLIVTGGNAKMHQVLDLTLPSKTRYAQKHGYDLLNLRSFKSFPDFNINGDDSIGLGFSRAITAMMMIEHYDIVVWLDADSIITNPNIRIEDIVDNQHALFFSYDWPVSLTLNTPNKNFSSGNFIIQNNPNTGEIFRVFLQFSQRFLNDVGSEQTCFNSLYNQTPFKQSIKVIEQKYLNPVPDFVMRTNSWKADTKRGKDGFKIVSPWNPDCFIAHLTGCSNEDRVDLLKNELRIYL